MGYKQFLRRQRQKHKDPSILQALESGIYPILEEKKTPRDEDY
jgi:hypothetical protein